MDITRNGKVPFFVKSARNGVESLRYGCWDGVTRTSEYPQTTHCWGTLVWGAHTWNEGAAEGGNSLGMREQPLSWVPTANVVPLNFEALDSSRKCRVEGG